MAQLMYKIANERPVDILSVNPSVPPGLVAFLDRALAKNPDERYQTGAEFAAALRAAAGAAARRRHRLGPGPGTLKVKQHLVRIVLGLAITLFFIGHAARIYEIGFIHQLDNIIYDARLRLTMPGKGNPDIVILDIDEKSLGEIGRWPWSRNVMARLMDKLFDKYGVALVGFDVVWAERDTSSGIEVLDALAQGELKDADAFQSAYRQLRGKLDFDSLFAASLKGRPVVLGYYFNSDENAVRVNAIPAPVLPKGTFTGRKIAFSSLEGLHRQPAESTSRTPRRRAISIRAWTTMACCGACRCCSNSTAPTTNPCRWRCCARWSRSKKARFPRSNRCFRPIAVRREVRRHGMDQGRSLRHPRRP